MNIADFEEKMAAFSFRQHQRVAAYLKTLEAHGFKKEDIFQYVATKKKEMLQFESILQSNDDDLRQFFPDCPECGAKYQLRAVTTPKGPANVNGYRSCWECPECAHEEYNIERPEVIVLKLYDGTNTRKRKKDRLKRLNKQRSGG